MWLSIISNAILQQQKIIPRNNYRVSIEVDEGTVELNLKVTWK
jgi:hypothetical protein